MQADKVQTILLYMKNKIPKEDYYRLEDALFTAPDKVYEKILSCDLLSIKKFTLITVFLGFFAVDRFILKDYAVAILKILGNIFFLGIVYLVDIHFVIKRVKEINIERIFNYL